VVLGDNKKAVFGAGSDLQIYHDGGNSFISDVGTGDLIIRAGNLRMQNSTGTAQYILADDGGAVQLRYNGSTKIATTATGIDVTGTVTADGLTVDGVGVISANSSSDAFRITQVGAGNALLVEDAANPDSTPFVVTSTGRVGVGTTAPADTLDVFGTLRTSSTGGYASLAATSIGDTIFGNNGNNWLVVKNGTPADTMRITSAGNVGIGTTNPSEKLTVIGNGVFGDSTTKYNAITISGGHVGDGGNDYGLTINSFEPAITLIDRSSGSGSTQLFGTNSGGLWLVGDTLNDGTIGHTANTTDFFVAKFEPFNTIFYTSGAESMRVASTGNVGIGTSSPNAASIVDAQSTTKGVRFPNMTTTQKNAIANVAGNVVFDTTLGKLCVNSGSGWETITSI
jgi:hypothetical protein